MSSQLPLCIMSYNVNFALMMNRELPGPEAQSVFDSIRKNKPDICFLQETNEDWERIFNSQFKDIFPHQKFRHSNQWCSGGMGCLSKYPFEDIAWLPPKSKWFHSWIVIVETPIVKVQFLNVHLRPPMEVNTTIPSLKEFIRSKDDRLQDLQNWFTKLHPEIPTVILGDFNEGHSGIFGGKSCVWLENSRDMKDAIKQYDPSTYTWNLPLALFTLRANFDHIFYNTFFTCSNSKVLVEGSSHHFPVVAWLYLNERFLSRLINFPGLDPT